MNGTAPRPKSKPIAETVLVFGSVLIGSSSCRVLFFVSLFAVLFSVDFGQISFQAILEYHKDYVDLCYDRVTL